MKQLKSFFLLFLIMLASCQGGMNTSLLKEIKLVPVYNPNNGMRIYLNTKGEQAIDEVFNYASFFNEGLAAVKSEDFHCKYINEQGETVIDASQYIKVSDFSHELAWGIPEENRDITVAFNKEGHEVFTLEGTPLTVFDENGIAVYENNGDYGFVNAKGEKTVIDGYNVQTLCFISQGLICVSKGGKPYGAMNEKGEVVIPLEYEQPLRFDVNGCAVIVREGQWGLINKKNEILIEPQYALLKVDGNNYFFVERLEDNDTYRYGTYRYGWCDKNGKMIIEPKWKTDYNFPRETFFSNGDKAFLHENEIEEGMDSPTCTYIDEKGNEIEFPYCRLVTPFFGQNNVAIARNGNKAGIINKKGEVMGEQFIYAVEYLGLKNVIDYGCNSLLDISNETIMHN